MKPKLFLFTEKNYGKRREILTKKGYESICENTFRIHDVTARGGLGIHWASVVLARKIQKPKKVKVITSA